jgi:hypothetical protein
MEKKQGESYSSQNAIVLSVSQSFLSVSTSSFVTTHISLGRL